MAKLLQTICTNCNTLFWSLSNSLAERIKEVSRARVLIIVSKAGKIDVNVWSFASSSIIILFSSCLLILVYSKPSGKCINRAEWNYYKVWIQNNFQNVNFFHLTVLSVITQYNSCKLIRKHVSIWDLQVVTLSTEHFLFGFSRKPYDHLTISFILETSALACSIARWIR